MFDPAPAPPFLSPADKQRLLFKTFPPKTRMVNYGGVLGNLLLMGTIGLVCLLLGIFFLKTALPDIVSDARVKWSGALAVEPFSKVTGSCKRYKFIFISCEAQIAYRPDPAREEIATVKQDFSFFGFSYSDNVEVLRSVAHPRLVTTSLATEHLGNRIVSLILLTGFFVAIAVATVRDGWRSHTQRQLEGKPVMLRLVLATIDHGDEHGNVKLSADVDGVVMKGANRLREGDSPVFLPWNPNLAIALLATKTGHLILLDAHMTVADFSDSERALMQTLLS